MNRRKKQVYGAVLVTGALAMLGDRILSGGADALPTPVAMPGRSLTELGVEPNAAPIVSVAATPFPQLSDQLQFDGGSRDIFDTTETVRVAMFGGAAADGAHRSTPPAAPGTVTQESFAQAHKLSAVMMGEGISFAVVDDKWLRVGDTLEGCRLAGMTGTSAVFDCAGARVHLSIIGTQPVEDGKKEGHGD